MTKHPVIARMILAAVIVAFLVLQVNISVHVSQVFIPPGTERENAPYYGQEYADAPARNQEQPKKFFAIHIGPSKTGTSSIQADMCRRATFEGDSNTFAPDKDNIIYVGKRIESYMVFKDPYLRKIINRTVIPLGTNQDQTTISVTPEMERRWYMNATRCMKEIMDEYIESADEISVLNEQLETDEETRRVLKQKFLQQCWSINVAETTIDISYMLNFSIVDSDEAYSYKGNHGRNGLRFRMFDILGYERLVVVGAYRRYADWLVSSYTEHIKRKHIIPNTKGSNFNSPCPKLFGFIKRHLNEGEEYRVRQWYDPISVTLPECLERGPSKLETKVLNYFQLPHSSTEKSQGFDSITTELYCHAFGEELTPHTCRHALESRVMKNNSMDSSNTHSSNIANKGSLSDSVYQQIMATAYRLGFLHYTVETKSCKGESVWCERVLDCTTSKNKCDSETKQLEAALNQITMNGTKTIVGTDANNITMFRDLSNYHTKIQRQSWTTSLPILCPSKDFLHQLLNKSLSLEEATIPEFYRSPLGKEKHVELFWGNWLREKKIFCWVDLLRLFEGATSWDEIINERMVTYDWGEPREYIPYETKELAY